MANLKQGADGGADFVGYGTVENGFIPVNFEWTAASVDRVGFVATRRYAVRSISARVEVAGSNGSAVTAVLKKAASGTAIASGTALHSGSVDLKGTAATTQTLVLSTTATDLIIDAGDGIGIDFTGTLTGATGVATVGLVPA